MTQSLSVESNIPSDIAALREEFPTWNFGTIWCSAASGPDARRLYAGKGVILLTAWTAAELAMSIRHEESHEQDR
jgi:hypothetical protein